MIDYEKVFKTIAYLIETMNGFQDEVLKYKYNMNPLTVTWPPILYTDYGLKNWRNWLDSGFDNISFYRNGKRT